MKFKLFSRGAFVSQKSQQHESVLIIMLETLIIYQIFAYINISGRKRVKQKLKNKMKLKKEKIKIMQFNCNNITKGQKEKKNRTRETEDVKSLKKGFKHDEENKVEEDQKEKEQKQEEVKKEQRRGYK
ncbi:Hypothetical_protein [Hexamita inflata]|uniref:Hypothetical_protein n=1 Tax=Hexamita inflata TaxID=28002 RepID=A0AA86TMT4_9EUKA|nr:Hypothetical protein HINF_LOCUS9736 [Hexamita inflata]